MSADAVLTLNAGSSSLKFGLYALDGATVSPVFTGKVGGLGVKARFAASDAAGAPLDDRTWPPGEGPSDPASALEHVLAWARPHMGERRVLAVGHRVVHGGSTFDQPARVTEEVRGALQALVALAPLHQPHNLAGLDAAARAFPGAVQVACFDTAFHRSQSWEEDAFALPRRYFDAGVRRYGFHGLSYAYLTQRLRDDWPALHAGRVVIGHLGNGASLCAVKGGVSVASTMGFTALDGLAMGTRSGALDPGVVLHLIMHDGMSAEAVSDLLYTKSGLKGLSGLSNDMRVLEASDDPRADEAIAYFTHRIRREIGALAAVMEGLDAVVFTAGVGANSARVRAAVTRGLGWLGAELDEVANQVPDTVISTPQSPVTVLRLETDEEVMIARGAASVLAQG